MARGVLPDRGTSRMGLTDGCVVLYREDLKELEPNSEGALWCGTDR